jgi:hypothetical protein
MRRSSAHDRAACADLRLRIGELEQRVAALEQPRPRLRLVDDETPSSVELAPVWPQLPTTRRARAQAHPLLLTVFVPGPDGTAYHRVAGGATAARPQVLNRVA